MKLLEIPKPPFEGDPSFARGFGETNRARRGLRGWRGRAGARMFHVKHPAVKERMFHVKHPSFPALLERDSSPHTPLQTTDRPRGGPGPGSRAGSGASSATFSTSWQAGSRSRFSHQAFRKREKARRRKPAATCGRNPWSAFSPLATKSKKLQKADQTLQRVARRPHERPHERQASIPAEPIPPRRFLALAGRSALVGSGRRFCGRCSSRGSSPSRRR